MSELETLLFSLYRLRATLQQLLSEEHAAIFNLPKFRGIRPDMQEVLATAVRRGIARLRRANGDLLDKAELGRLIRSGFSDLPRDSVEVELTSKGGGLWEKKASPLWDYFLDEGEGRVIGGMVWIVLEGKSRAWLQCVDQTLRRFGFFGTNQRRITMQRNWHPVYWKTFKLGYSLMIDTGHPADDERGECFLHGIAAGDERLANAISVLGAIWDAEWVACIQIR